MSGVTGADWRRRWLRCLTNPRSIWRTSSADVGRWSGRRCAGATRQA